MSISQFTIERHKAYDAATPNALLRHQHGETWKQICQSYGFDRNNFATYLENKGIKKKRVKRKIHTDLSLLEKIYNEYLTGDTTLTDLAKKYNLFRKTLSKDLKQKYNADILQDGKKLVNQYFFDKIDCAEKAYWLGFLYADGYNSKNYNIELGLQEADKDHIIKFATALNAHHKISCKKRTKSYRISIKSKILGEDLCKQGCIANKTYFMEMPDSIDNNLMSHFVRGYFDGDGCIYWKQNKATVSFVTASYLFANQFTDFLCQNNIAAKVYKIRKRDNWVIKIQRKDDIENFYYYIYQNASNKIWLTRKYLKYNAYLSYKYFAV